jgi:hypothetical protein
LFTFFDYAAVDNKIPFHHRLRLLLHMAYYPFGKIQKTKNNQI